jgi:flagellar basal-body rod modification protein FlgD
MSVPVEAIGGVLNSQNNSPAANNTINQNDFIKLFLSQLQFQDPLEPVDNREFLAQLAQFSNLEQTRQTSQNTEGLLVMNSSAQALQLLNRNVQVETDAGTLVGTVTAVKFTNAGPELSIDTGATQATTGIRLSQVSLVTPKP